MRKADMEEVTERMSEHERMLLEDAIETAVEYRKQLILAERIIALQTVLCVASFILLVTTM